MCLDSGSPCCVFVLDCGVVCGFGAVASTKEVILGTEDGQIFEIAVDEADKKEKYVKSLFTLSELQEGIKALQVRVCCQRPSRAAVLYLCCVGVIWLE